MKRALVALVVVATLGTLTACRSGDCRTVTTTRELVSGSATYQPASTKTPFVTSNGHIWSMGRSSLELDVNLKSANEGERAVRISLSGLTPGPSQMLTGDTLGRACLVLQTSAAPTCLTLTGVVDVRALEADCYHHESGISACAENIDVSLHAKAEDRGVSMRVDLDIVRAQQWTNTECTRDDGLF
jgi:hypothetical protein